MEYAIVGGVRIKPLKGLKGNCPVCGNPVIAKCGSMIMHHWAHVHQFNCDPWWENETPWHREWKSHFNEDSREYIFFDEYTGEKHIADVHTKSGVTLEFQNSPMSQIELQSRENFYKKMIWIVNAQSFVSNINLVEKVPSFEIFKDDNFVFRQGMVSVLLWRKSENPKYQTSTMVLIESLHEFPQIQSLLEESKCFGFTWKRKRDICYTSKVPVFLDIGNDSLLWLRKREQYGQPFFYLTLISKSRFITKYA